MVNNTFINILSIILGSKKKSIEVLEILFRLENKRIINKEIFLFFIKIITIILSYYPDKLHIIKKIIKIVENDKNGIVLKILKNVEISKFELLDDKIIDVIIFKTFNYIEKSLEVDNELILSLIYEILNNTSKIKSNNDLLKANIYLLYLKNSSKILEESISENMNYLIYSRTVSTCNSSTKLINQFLDN